MYRLGKVTFRLTNCEPQLLEQIDVLLPKCEQSVKARELAEVVSIDMLGRTELRDLINIILRKHDGAIWIDAGCLLSPNGKRILIVGKSSAGKSTLTMAMALGPGWHVITEDLLLIDAGSDKLFKFATPFSFKPGTVDLLKQTLGQDVGAHLLGEWLPLDGMAVQSDQPAAFDFALLLTERDGARALEVETITPHEFVRSLVRCSNMIRIKDGSDKMLAYLSNGKCFKGRFGSLQERMDFLEGLDR